MPFLPGNQGTDEDVSSTFTYWRRSLKHFLLLFEALRRRTRHFYLKTFGAFALLNLACYWWALLTAYANLLLSEKALEYVLTGFPVALLGAVFDCLSLIVTLYIIRRALATESNVKYMSYLSIDIGIAILATFWVLFVFTVSGWLVSFIVAHPESLSYRTTLYHDRVEDVLVEPFKPEHMKYVYFGGVMGASALLPTLIHFGMAGWSALRAGIFGDSAKLERR